MSSTAEQDFSPLDAALAGQALSPGDDGWDEARLAWNLAVDQHPAAVVFAEGPDDVAHAVRFAAENGLRVAAQGTGHAAAMHQTLDDTILVKTARMTGVEIDADGRVARVQAGALSGGRRGRGRRARPGAAAGLVAGRRRDRLHRGRRPGLAGARVRFRLQQRAGRGRGQRRGRAGARRRGHQRRAVLGHPRRRGLLRHRDRPGAGPVPDRVAVRRRRDVRRRARARRAGRLPRLGPAGAARGHLERALPDPAAHPGRPRAPPRPARWSR